MLTEIKVGIIGAGLMGYRHATALNSIRGSRIIAVADPVIEKAEQLTLKFDALVFSSYRELLALPDLDAVVIAVPDDLHLEPTLASIGARKHILLEKPLATNLDEGRMILDALRDAPDLVFLVGHLLRFDPRFFGAAQAVSEGAIGEVVHIALRRNSSILGPQRYEGRARLHFHVSAHDADLLRLITGLEVERLYAQSARKVLGDEKHIDTLLATLNLTGGALAQMEASWVLPPAMRSALDGSVEVVGEKGVIYVDTLQQGLTILDYEGFAYPDTMRYWEQHGRSQGLVRRQAEHFIDCIDNHLTPLATANDGYEAICICQALQDSIQSGEPVKLSNSKYRIK